MMHLGMVVGAIALAGAVQWGGSQFLDRTKSHQYRWQFALGLLLFPPLLLLMTALAILVMGPQSSHMPAWEGWLSYGIAIGFLGSAIILLLRLAIQAWRSVRQVRTYARCTLHKQPVRILPSSFPFSAQVGLWHPELVVSQGLLDTFAPAHVHAVLVHERGHLYYQDTFWFFWLGWLRRLTHWLPQTEALWQELLLLREIRADQWATGQIDALLLAEALLWSVKSWSVKAPNLYLDDFCAAFSAATGGDRLEERIDDLLGEADLIQPVQGWVWVYLILALFPMMTIPFHS